jgi:hypothetical protein
MSKPKPTRYRTTNWSTDNDALRKIAADLAREGDGLARAA